MPSRRRGSGSAPSWFTTHQVATLFGVSIATVVNWEKRGLIEARRTPGGHRRIALHELVRFARANDQPLPPELVGQVAEPETGPRRILVVHRDRSFGELLCDYLALEQDIDARLADRGLHAGHLLATWAPHLVLLDDDAPEIPVDAFLALSRELERPPRVVGLHAVDSRRAPAAGGLDGVLERSTDVAELVRAARSYLPASSGG